MTISINNQINKQQIAYFLLPLLVFFAASWSGLVYLSEKWLDVDHGAYNHGFLLLAVSLYLLYTRIDFARHSSNQWSMIGFLLAIVFASIAFVGGAVSVVSLQVLAGYLFVYALILAIFGWAVFKQTLIPVGLVAFALPLWDSFSVALQTLTHQMAYFLMKLTSIPILKEEYFLIVPAGRFEVESSCSGISYFLAAVPLAIIYGIINFKSRKNIIIAISSIVVASVIANWLRVFIIVVAGQMSDMQHSLVKDHYNLGWIIFGIMFITLVFLFNRRLKESDLDIATATAEDVTIESANSGLTRKYALSLTGLSVVFLMYQFVLNGNDPQSEEELSAWVSVPADFRFASPVYDMGTQVDGAHESTYLSSVVSPDAHPVQLYVGLVPWQTQGREVASTHSSPVFDRKRWTENNKQIVVIDNVEIEEFELKSKSTGQLFVLWRWYKVDGQETGSAAMAKLYELSGYLKGDNSGSMVVLAAPQSDNALSQFEKIYRQLAQN